jgi:toxin ParE1/3/4
MATAKEHIAEIIKRQPDDSTYDDIYEKAQLLRNHPRLGYKYEPERSREVRILLYEHYRIAYLLKPGDNIEILGVFHGALDIDRYFI